MMTQLTQNGDKPYTNEMDINANGQDALKREGLQPIILRSGLTFQHSDLRFLMESLYVGLTMIGLRIEK